MNEIPKGWVLVPLKAIVKVEWGNTSITKKAYVPEGYPAFSATGKDGFLPRFEWKGPAVILSAIGARCGKCFYADGEWTAIKNTIVIQGNGFLDHKLLYHYLNDEKGWEISGSSQPFITMGSVQRRTYRLAPFNEQRRIVEKLEKVFSRVKAGEGRLASIPRILKRLRQSVLASAASGRLTANWRDIHKSGMRWENCSLGSICTFIGGSQPPKSQFVFEPRKDYIRLIQIRDYKSDRNVTFIPKASARRTCNKTDVMIGRYGPPLFQILRGIEGAYNVALMKAVPKSEKKLLNDFLYIRLQDPTLQAFIINASERTVGQDGVRKDLLEGYEIELPPLPEQQEIVRRVEELFKTADALDSGYLKAKAHVDKLTQSILAKAFRGELVPQDPNDEPASVLLERITAERNGSAVVKRRSRK